MAYLIGRGVAPAGHATTLLGVRLYYVFYGPVLASDKAFEGKVCHSTPTQHPPLSPIQNAWQIGD